MRYSDCEFLVVTNKRDITSDFIVRELKRRKLKFFRFNTEDAASFKYFYQPEMGTSELIVDSLRISVNSIKAAYFRRPETPVIDASVSDNRAIEYCVDEWEYILRSMYIELGDKWFSHPNMIILAEDKPRQLRLAAKLGFMIPETIITNDKSKLANLFARGPTIAKPLRHSLIEDSKSGRVIFTSDIESLDVVDAEQLRIAPVIFQRKLLKRKDLRVTVVGDRVFAVEIDSQRSSESSTDWRRGTSTELDHIPVELDERLAAKCIAIVKALGLRFGAIDLVLDSEGQYWFLECNPNGQWAWIEHRTGLPISAAIVDAMVELRHAG